jgi:hypothetical protein
VSGHLGRGIGLLLAAGLAVGVTAQATPPRTTTLESIRAYPGYFHLQQVVLHGELVAEPSVVVLEADGRRVDVHLGGAGLPAGPVVARGHVIDVGRLEAGDPRLRGYLPANPDAWPARSELLLLVATSLTPADPVVSATVRTLALEPWRFDGESVTVTGQFRGRNLYGDLPGAPAHSEHDFVLRAAGGAVWVTGLEPRGRGFELRPAARVDTGRWVEVTGVARRDRGLVLIEGATIRLADPMDAPDEPADAPVPPPAPLAEVIFAIPTIDETGVPRSVVVRLQFSRGLDPATVGGNIELRPIDSGAAPVAVEATYRAGNTSVSLTPAAPLDAFRRYAVETLDGLRAFDGSAVAPFEVTFTTGG